VATELRKKKNLHENTKEIKFLDKEIRDKKILIEIQKNILGKRRTVDRVDDGISDSRNSAEFWRFSFRNFSEK